jgi:hypothetical protein
VLGSLQNTAWDIEIDGLGSAEISGLSGQAGNFSFFDHIGVLRCRYRAALSAQEEMWTRRGHRWERWGGRCRGAAQKAVYSSLPFRASHLPTWSVIGHCFHSLSILAPRPYLTVLLPRASPVIPTPMEERILLYCSENEEGYTAGCGHCSELHMTVGLRHESVGRHDGLTIATYEGREKGGIAFKSDRNRWHH